MVDKLNVHHFNYFELINHKLAYEKLKWDASQKITASYIEYYVNLKKFSTQKLLINKTIPNTLIEELVNNTNSNSTTINQLKAITRHYVVVGESNVTIKRDKVLPNFNNVFVKVINSKELDIISYNTLTHSSENSILLSDFNFMNESRKQYISKKTLCEFILKNSQNNYRFFYEDVSGFSNKSKKLNLLKFDEIYGDKISSILKIKNENLINYGFLNDNLNTNNKITNQIINGKKILFMYD